MRYVDRHRTHLFDDVIYLKTEKQGIPIEVAIMYNTDYSENIHSYVNNINTIEGGTHLVGFRMALTRTLKKYADSDPVISKQIEKAKIEIAGEDFREGLTAVISIKVAEPQFEGQTKTKLGNSEVTGAVQQAVSEALTNYLEEHPKEAKQVCEKVILAATARIAARKARESVQRNLVVFAVHSEAHADALYDIHYRLALENLVPHNLLHVKDFSSQWQDGLPVAVASLFR